MGMVHGIIGIEILISWGIDKIIAVVFCVVRIICFRGA